MDILYLLKAYELVIISFVHLRRFRRSSVIESYPLRVSECTAIIWVIIRVII